MLKKSFSEIEIETPYRRIAAKKWGSENGIPTIGLHGWLDNANTFDGIAPLLPQLQLVAMDLPGHGRSDHRPPGAQYHYTDYVDDVIAVADSLGWHAFNLLGHSMGAGVSIFLAGAFPERVGRLMLIEGLGAVTAPVDDGPERLRHAVLKQQRPHGKAPQRPRALETLVRARSQAGLIKPSSAEILVKRAVRTCDQGVTWQSDPRLNIPMVFPLSENYVQTFLKRITAPILLIIAEHGILKKRPYYRSRLMLMENLHQVWLPGHHHLHLDDPEPVAKTITRFLDGRDKP